MNDNTVLRNEIITVLSNKQFLIKEVLLFKRIKKSAPHGIFHTELSFKNWFAEFSREISFLYIISRNSR